MNVFGFNYRSKKHTHRALNQILFYWHLKWVKSTISICSTWHDGNLRGKWPPKNQQTTSHQSRSLKHHRGTTRVAFDFEASEAQCERMHLSTKVTQRQYGHTVLWLVEQICFESSENPKWTRFVFTVESQKRKLWLSIYRRRPDSALSHSKRLTALFVYVVA